MLVGTPIQNVLFLDIETVPQYPNYNAVPEEWQQLWDAKANILLKTREEETPEAIYGRAGIYAEFGKIVCISCGVLQGVENNRKLIVKSFANDNEAQLLLSFCEMLTKWSSNETKYLCAHNGKEFDFPYLCRRLIINEQTIPPVLNIAGKKPWEVTHIDTMELWKFGDFKNFTSLNLLAHCLGIPTPKDDIDGSMVAKVYYEEKNLERIATYCQKDVITLTQIFLRLSGEKGLDPDAIDFK